MMKKTVRGVMALAVFLFSAGAVQARDLFQDAEADVFVLGGGSTLVDANYFKTPSSVYHSRFQWDTKYAVGVEVPFRKLLGIEMAFASGPNNLYLTNVNVIPHRPVEYTARYYSGSLSAVIHSPRSFRHIRPYAEGGVEYDRYSPTQGAIDYAYYNGWASVSTAYITHNDKFGINLGVGINRKIKKRLSFRIDVRDHITSSPAFGLPPQATTDSSAIFPVSGRANNIQYTAGFVLHLGKL